MKFCKKCKQQLQEPKMFCKVTSVVFEDGTYCEKCATIKVKEARK